MQCQVGIALGKDGCSPIGCYAYGYIDGATQTSGAPQTWVNGDERMMFYGHEALVRSALEGAFGKGFESKAARITEAVFIAKPWNHPKLIEAGGRDGVDFATTDAMRLQHMIAGKDTPPTTFAPTRNRRRGPHSRSGSVGKLSAVSLAASARRDREPSGSSRVMIGARSAAGLGPAIALLPSV
jgi:hypothetical protein